jgi:hypothetical protein
MPRASPTSATSAASSSHSSRNSEHFPYRYVDLENVMQVFSRRENITTAINLVDNNQTAFAEIAFLDYLLQNIQRSEIRLEKDKRLARARITRLLSKKSSDKLYQWIINSNLDTPFHLPIGSPHTPPEMHTPSLISHSSHSPDPKPVQIRQHTQSEIDEINYCREFLMQNFPEDQPAGSFANPFTIEDDDDNQEVIVFNGVKIQERGYCYGSPAGMPRSNQEVVLFLTHVFTRTFHHSVSHIVSPPNPFHMSVSSNDVYDTILLRTYTGL